MLRDAKVFLSDGTTFDAIDGTFIRLSSGAKLPLYPMLLKHLGYDNLSVTMARCLLEAEKLLFHHSELKDLKDLHHGVCCELAETFQLWDTSDHFPLWLSILVQSTGREMGVLDTKE